METSSQQKPYSDFINEVFITPIRSVLIIDDQYPTLEEQLNSHLDPAENKNSPTKNWRKQSRDISEIIQHFRKRKWLIDIHDGSNLVDPDWKDVCGHLHQSDLLILDYQLDGNHSGGDKCIKVIRHLSENEQFNLTVVHTEHESTTEVFNNILLSLLVPCPLLAKTNAKLQQNIENWELEDPLIVGKLVESIDDSIYIEFRDKKRKLMSEFNTHEGGQFSQLSTLFDNKPTTLKINKTSLLLWVLRQYEVKIANKFSTAVDSSIPTWQRDGDEINWIRTDKLFVTVNSKRVTKDLPDALLKALILWAPNPPRLVLSKLRSQLASMGVAAEDSFLGNTELQLAWYHKLLESSSDARRSRIQETIINYWNGISHGLEGNLIEFTTELLSNIDDASLDSTTTVERHFSTSPSQMATLQLNAHNCSTKPTGFHLAPGHIIKRKDTFWLCLSPSCDLVPGQKEGGRFGRLKSAIPFKAVQLTKWANPVDALSKVNDNCQIFIELDNKIIAFRYLPAAKENSQEDSIAPNPAWDELYAKNKGKFPTDGSMVLELGQLEWNDKGEGNVSAIWEQGIVVGQLRYEYAINLMQRLGYTLSRVGLDFTN
ncbi:response regulator receiver domain [Rubritalea sp.]|uniref:response regulator receiver domain n=1 Tax=Rubritalea sp. TaxID=2109375 RepID=UPI003EF0E955